MIGRHRVLAHILGRTDAAFAPWRSWGEGGDHGPAEAYRWRRAHLAGDGIAWTSPGDTDEQRRDAIQALNELASAELVRTRRGASKIVGASLTDAGDTLARELVGLPASAPLADLLDEFEGLARIGYVADLGDGMPWVPEWALAGQDPHWRGAKGREGRAQLVWVEECMLPLLVRGLAERGTDIHGRAWYRLVGDRPEVLEPTEPAEQSADARAAYYESFEAAQRRLMAAPRGHDGEIGELPLPGTIDLRASVA